MCQPHDFNASAAGRRSRSIASNISMAAASRAPGVMSKRSRQAEENTYGEDHPRHEQSRKPYAIERPAPLHNVAGDVLVGMCEARNHENPGEHQEQDVGMV